jgi:tetratricopeptide (TPR) repeat protein
MADARPADPGRFFANVLADQHYQRGVQRERQGRWEQALESYRRACALNGRNTLYLLARGHLCQHHGLEPEAEECYRVALQLRPDDTVVLYNQAQLYAARGQLEAARTNLARIVAGNVDSLGDRAAPIYCRLGDIALRREDYATAALHYRRAAECAPEHRYAAAALGALDRFAEFPAPFEPDGRIAPKIALYGYAGAMVLGLAGDDGITIPAYPGLGFESLQELALSLARFTGVAGRYRWSFDAVLALEPESQPLAVALASTLGARPCAAEEQVPRGSSTLAVTATAGDPAALTRSMAALRGRCARTLCYAVGLTHPAWEYAPAPQVVSAPIRLEFPWNRREASAAEHAEAYGAELAEILAATGPDESVAAHARWYAQHPRLSFDPASLAPREPREGALGTLVGPRAGIHLA